MGDSLSERVAERKRSSFLVDSIIRLVKEKPLGVAGGVIILILLLTAILANFLAPYGMNESHAGDFRAPPSATYWLGTDNVGRDILSRVIYGARISVIVGLAGATVATIVSVSIGILCGYMGGKFDLVVQRVVDAWMCIPSLILMMIIISVIGGGIWQLVVCLGLTWGVTGTRIIRSATISIKENVYLKAAKAVGCPTSRILTQHIMPNIMAPTIILFTTRVPAIIMVEASLSFLGFGIPPPTPSWGGMIGGMGRVLMFRAPWMVLWPGVALATVVYGANIFGDAVRDILDPRLRGGGGRYGDERRKRDRKSPKPS